MIIKQLLSLISVELVVPVIIYPVAVLLFTLNYIKLNVSVPAIDMNFPAVSIINSDIVEVYSPASLSEFWNISVSLKLIADVNLYPVIIPIVFVV
jgi:hypothetical protein